METKHVERFESKVDRSGGPDACHPWTASRDKDGYGWFTLLSGNVRANRVALELKLGRPLAPGMRALHTCDNPPCCNGRHLYEGTNKQNSHDMVRRSRVASGDANGSRLHPERLVRGEDWARTHQNQARGDRNGARLHPERLARGERQGSAKASEALVRSILEGVAQNVSQKALAEILGVSHSLVNRVALGRTWAHVAPEIPRVRKNAQRTSKAPAEG